MLCLWVNQQKLILNMTCRWSTTAGFVVIIGGVAVYLRFVKGWSLGDFMYVTKASLQNFKDSMQEGKHGRCWSRMTPEYIVWSIVRGGKTKRSCTEVGYRASCSPRNMKFIDPGVPRCLWLSCQNLQQQMSSIPVGPPPPPGVTKLNEQLREATEDLIDKLRNVTSKQDDMLEQQAAMDEQLRLVGDDVHGVHHNVQLLQDQVRGRGQQRGRAKTAHVEGSRCRQ